MIFSGNSLQLTYVEDGIALLTFNACSQSVNTLNKATLLELETAIECLNKEDKVQGLILNSSKDSFIVGADINEFLPLFKQGDTKVRQWLQHVNELFCRLEDLSFPTLSAINGYALGGGCECVLATDYRIGNKQILIGLPEVKLGIIPGFGGTVRMPRVIGADNAIELISSGQAVKASRAQKLGLIDAITEDTQLLPCAIKMIKQAIAGELPWQERRQLKKGKLRLSPPEAMLSFATAKALVSAKASPHYPAPLLAVKTIEAAAVFERDQALTLELNNFIPITKENCCHALISIYQQDQNLKHRAKSLAKGVQPANSCAVIGAGIMGGGIAYQCASSQISVVMKDITTPALDQGLAEAGKLLVQQVKRGKISTEELSKTLNLIKASLDCSAIAEVQFVIEAVVENPLIKQQVLAEVEQEVSHGTIICSNTSTIPITVLANALSRPQQFCGMHFFNPVHRMPLVEVIKGDKSSDETIARVVALALTMKKIPVVVNDCPGFFVNRVLFPYLFGFCQLIAEGVDFRLIDRIMENDFGWPMGPAYLLDVIGMDTAHHAASVMAEAYPNRMASPNSTIIDHLHSKGLLGQKTRQGFYAYEQDEKGKPIKSNNSVDETLIKQHFSQTRTPIQSSEKQHIINAMMIPMLNEVALCLEEGIISSAGEADMALIYGLGFPPFQGGALHYLDKVGLNNYIQTASAFYAKGAIYHVPESLIYMAQNNKRYYPEPDTDHEGAKL